MNNEINEKKFLKISEVTKKVGVSRKALQEYDKLDLVHPTAKTEGGYWLYDKAAVQKIAAIQMFSLVGYKRSEIKEFVELPMEDMFDKTEYIREKYLSAIERLKEKRAQIDGLITIAECMAQILSVPPEVLRELRDNKNGGYFSQLENIDVLKQQAEYMSTQDEKTREMVSLLAPTVPKLMRLACCEDMDSDDTMLKVREVFDEYMIALPAILKKAGEMATDESMTDKPLKEQLEAFREFVYNILSGQEVPNGDPFKVTLNRRYGEGTDDKIRKMTDIFIEKMNG
ncbi:MAG: MerR family transcriptional regulator [Lachnospiraceae bacterium]|nr:MerR family transcriptional regulator [Lachnospiraceae bacterium]